MVFRQLVILPITAAWLLAGCVTGPGPVAVTRFHQVDAPAAMPAGIYQFVTEESYSGWTRPNLANFPFESAVTDRLNMLGFRSILTVANGQSDYLVHVSVDRSVRQTPAGGGIGVGVGGGTSIGGIGVGVGVDISRLLLGSPPDSVLTQLTVRIVRRRDSVALWEGRAETVVREGSTAARPFAVADRLSEALFRDYPGRSGETITVR